MVSQTIHIRRATRSDLPAIQAVAAAAWWDTYKGLFPDSVIESRLRLSYNPTRLAERLPQVDSFLVAELAGRLVGFAQFFRRAHEEIMVGALYVHPEHQGCGVGRSLLSGGIAALGPVRRLYLDVAEVNRRARRFYERMGFRIFTEFEVDMDGTPFVFLELVLELGDAHPCDGYAPPH